MRTGPASTHGTFLNVEVKVGDKVIYKSGNLRDANKFAQGYNAGWWAAKAEEQK